LIFLTEELAVELGPEVTVNAVAPGQINESAADIAEFDATFVDRAIVDTARESGARRGRSNLKRARGYEREELGPVLA
jgi:NAD(P)-dependent dehydrogenase (short-subunit alcohol dehydrogenase family)